MIAVIGFTPGRYVFMHLWHAPNRHDITKPREDVSWRSSKQLLISIIVLVCLGAFSVFIFTPTAIEVGRSPHLWTVIIAGFGGWMLVTVARGFSTGSIEPMTRGGSVGPYHRINQPKRFWASMAWNATWGCGCLWMAFLSHRDAAAEALTTECYNEERRISLEGQVSACSTLIDGKNSKSREDLAGLYGARGVAYHQLKDWDRALSDYSRAIALEPKSAHAHFNRALVFLYRYELRPALADLTAAIDARPNWSDAYEQRAWTYEHLNDERHAAEDRKKMNELRAKDLTS